MAASLVSLSKAPVLSHFCVVLTIQGCNMPVDHSAITLISSFVHSLVSVCLIIHSIFQNYLSPWAFLMLDDEGCLNSFLPMDLFLSIATHLALGMRFRVLWQYLGDCSHQWQLPSLLGSGSTLLYPTRWILQVFNFNSLYSHLLECTRFLGDHFH